MWNVVSQHSIDFSTMVCNNTDPQQSGITLVKLVHYYDQGVRFTINVTEHKMTSILEQLKKITEAISCEKSLFGYTFTFKVDLKNLYLFNLIIAVLRNEISDFSRIDLGIRGLMAATKEMVINTNRLHQKAAVAKIEDDVDNNQRAAVFISALKSEKLLRARYDFPNPNYKSDMDSIGVVSTTDPEVLAMAAAVRVADQEEYDYAEHDDSDYTYEENSLIYSLKNKLKNLEKKLIERGYLEQEDTEEKGLVTVLSARSKELISNPDIADSPANVESANFALNVITSLRALAPGGSHSHNGAMIQSKITGYGMRNVVALMWKCCRETNVYDEEDDELDINLTFMPGIKFRDALAALARGIADGARGKNRNDEEIGDNLEEQDHRACDRGRYNALIEAFNGILREVSIIYEITDLLLNELKREIIIKLVNHNSVKDYDKAKLYLDIWHGRVFKLGNRGYLDFERQVKQAFPVMVTQFLTRTCAHAPTYQAELRVELNREIKRIEAQSLGFSFIDQVSPTEDLLREQWDLIHPELRKRSKQVASRFEVS